VAAVPQIEGLTVESMLEFAKTSVAALRHLPDERDWDGLNRKWVADFLYTIDRIKFEKVIKDAVKARKEHLEEKHNLNVEMRPEFAQALQNCMSFSSIAFLFGAYNLVENCRASLLMKTSSKRKRTKA
jgi:rubrerythrin